MSRVLERKVRDTLKAARRLKAPAAIVDTFGRYRDDPAGFCRDVLGVESATRRSTGEPYQFSALESVRDCPQVAVRSGHGVGKTGLDAWAALWWLVTRPLSRVVVLAPEYSRQIRAVLFAECRKWARRAKVKLPVEVLASRIIVDDFGEEWSATGMSAAGDAARLEGFHAEGGVLLVLDETKGIPQDAFDAVMGALSGGEDSRLLVTSVPGGAGAGPFWKACSDPAWRVHHIPSTDSSRVSPQWVERRRADWGEGSPLWQTRVLGEFADAGDGVLFPLPLLEAATGRELPADARATRALGVDVARSVAGDQNAVAFVRGGKLEAVMLWRSPDTMQTVQRVVERATVTGAEAIAVDVGGVGGGVVDRLRQLGRPVEEVAFGSASTDPTRFLNRRAELYWTFRDALERGAVSLPDDDELVADLSAIRYSFNSRGQIVLEAKDEVRARLGRSPDRADAVVLACWAASGGGMRGRGMFEYVRREAEAFLARVPPPAGVVSVTPERPLFGAADACPARCPGCGSDRFLRPTTVGHWQCAGCGADG